MTNETWTQRLQRVVPGGSSTFSKTPRLVPEEPGVIVRGDGCRVWDANGREFIDFRSGLGPVTLGYRFPAVDAAIRSQLESGISFGHPHPLEAEVAELLCEAIPGVRYPSGAARFLKTGGEAIAACVRLARCHTGRDHVVQIGYNGWLNSLASGGMALPGQALPAAPSGVPAALSALHHQCPWNRLDLVEQVLSAYPNQVAAIVVAADYRHMAAGATFYPALRKLVDAHGSVLIYDEIVTGFRIARGGVQEYFGVLPDLSVFSKGIANGVPLSAYVGRREILQALDRVPVSSTFAGETLSLAAAKATLQTYRDQDVIAHLWRQGETLWNGVNHLFDRYRLPCKVEGFWPCPQFVFSPDAPDFRERFFRAAYRHGVSLYDVSYVNFSHRDADIAQALHRLETACSELTHE